MIRFIAADLDGTLLDSRKNLPEGFFDLVRRMKKLGITFAAASGRQYYGVEMLFEPIKNDMVFIAENGGAAFEQGRCIYSLPMENEDVIQIAEAAERLYDKGVRVLLSGEKCAYVKDSDTEFARNCRMYCARLETIEDLKKIPDNDRIIKVAVFDMNAEKLTYPEMKRFDDRYNVILSNTCWVDIVGKNVNKGEAVDRLLKRLGIAADEAMCFGDYLNDLEMMSVCGHSYAMENGHPLLKKAAANIAPSNDDNGVVREILKAVPQLMTEGLCL